MSAKDVMNDARIASGITMAKGLAALVEDRDRLAEENRELREKNAELRKEKGELRVRCSGMGFVCSAVERALGDDSGRRYTVDELAEKLKERLMPEGYEWPRFEDGKLVRTGDLANCGCSTPIEVDGFELTVRNGDELYWSVEGMRDDHGTLQREWIRLESGERVKRPEPHELLGADGKPIEVGDTIYGRSDGKAWTVLGFNQDNAAYPVRAVGEDGTVRDLKPEWLTHERPGDAKDGEADSGDSWEKWCEDFYEGTHGAEEMHVRSLKLAGVAE